MIKTITAIAASAILYILITPAAYGAQNDFPLESGTTSEANEVKKKVARDIVIAITEINDPAKAFDAFPQSSIAAIAEVRLTQSGLQVDEKKYPGLKDKLITAFATPVRQVLVDGYPDLYADMIALWAGEMTEADLTRSHRVFTSAFMRKIAALRDLQESAYANNPKQQATLKNFPSPSAQDIIELEAIVQNDEAFVERYSSVIAKMEKIKSDWTTAKIESSSANVKAQYSKILASYGLAYQN